jgi:hypothetical protein
MSFQLKRIVFFFCILNFGLGCCLGNRANAGDPPHPLFQIYITSILNTYAPRTISGFVSCNGIGLEGVNICEKSVFICDQFSARAITDSQGYYKITVQSGYEMTIVAKKEGYEYEFDPPFRSIPVGNDNQSNQDFSAYKYTVSGKVTDNNGAGLKGVEIYGTNTQLAVTDSLGNYQAEVCSGKAFTLTPQLAGFTFTPASHPIPVNQYNQVNKDFIAQTGITLSGHVKWNNCVPTQNYCTTPLSNPLSMVAMEAYAEDGSLYSRIVTGGDGNYSITIPGGWKGWIKPSRAGFEFDPEKINYPSFTWEKDKYDFAAPMITVGGGHIYKITVFLIGENGGIPPMSNHVDIEFDGISHAYGSRWKSNFYDTGNYYISWHSGWIGDITPSNDPDLPSWPGYTFTPPSFRLNEILTSDLTFTFIAKPK